MTTQALAGWRKLEKPLPSFLQLTPTFAYTKGPMQLLYSPQEPQSDGLWQHASVSCSDRYPTWEEIKDVRDTFFDPEADVFQVLPPKREYVNLHPNCFHLWSPIGRRVTPQVHP